MFRLFITENHIQGDFFKCGLHVSHLNGTQVRSSYSSVSFLYMAYTHHVKCALYTAETWLMTCLLIDFLTLYDVYQARRV